MRGIGAGVAREWTRWIVLMTCLDAACCSSGDSAVSTSLSNMVYETKTYSGEFFKDTEVFSINGLLPVKDVGAIHHYSRERRSIGNLWGIFGRKMPPPSTIIAVSRNHSFRLIGEPPAPADGKSDDRDKKLFDTVVKVRNQLLKIRDTTDQALLVATQLSTTTQDVQKAAPARTAAVAGDADPAKKPDGKVAEVADLRATKQQLDGDLFNERRELDALLSAPGIIIARWSTKSAVGGSAAAGSNAKLSANANNATDGFMILGGIRVVELVVGDDFQQMIAGMSPQNLESFEKTAITTYLMQARFVSYVTDSDVSSSIAASFTYDSTHRLRDLDQVTIEFYMNSYAQLGNRGDIGALTWRKAPFCFVCGDDLASIDKNSSHADDQWQTIDAEFVNAGDYAADAHDELKKALDANELPPNQDETGRKRCTAKKCDTFGEPSQWKDASR